MRTGDEQRLRAGFDDAAAALTSVLDPEQEPVADRLAALGAALERGRRPWRRRRTAGAYLHGPVGRGKTWLVDVLLAQLPSERVLRLHAHDAARQLHAQVARYAGGRSAAGTGGRARTGRRSGTASAVDSAVATLLDGVDLLFLDELHAHDPGDAILLSRLVRALPGAGAVLVATSNYPPQGLLPDPRHHHLVLPLVAALEGHCEVLEVAGPVDHRELGHGGGRPRWSSGAWACPGSAAQLAALGLPVPEPGDRVRLLVGGRPLWAVATDSDRVHLAFPELCDGSTSVGDLLELADRYGTVLLGGVPRLSTAVPDARRRFADLVDVCWDRDVRLVVLAAAPVEATLDADVTDAARLRSRLELLQAV